jgi:uncharacterized membrane protein YkvA (DUF1232 family)
MARRPKSRSAKNKLVDLLLFIPNLVRLLVSLLRDPRVSSADKSILAGVVLYVISPIDLLPDFIPFIGQVDDSYLLAIALLRLLNRADYSVVMDHWKGQVNIKDLASSIATMAEAFLPRKIKNVLRGRIERPTAPREIETVPPAVNE